MKTLQLHPLRPPTLFLTALLATTCSEPNPPTKAVAAVDSAATSVDAAGAAVDAEPPQLTSPALRGWKFSRNVVHIHSSYSHDACDNWIDDHPGDVSATCLQDLRTALCESGLDVAFMTDHPSHMKDFGFKDLLQIKENQGDTAVGPPGQPHANVVHCPKSDKLPAHDVVRTVGYEGTHNMAIGIHNHFADSKSEGLSFADEGSKLPEVQASVAQIHLNKGLSCNAHSEEDDISVQRMVDSGLDCMEVYNTHANFKTIVGMSTKGAKMNFARIFLLDRLLGPAAQSPDPDLGLLIMLDIQPEAAFTKWQAVQAQRWVTGVIGSDVHQNVVLEPYCAKGGQLEGFCDALVDKYPHLVKLLLSGGPVMMADGRRLDDYLRLLRWVSNRTLVTPNKPSTELAELTKDGIKAGRSWVVYDVLGDPQDLDFAAYDQKTGKWVEMGGQVSLGSTLHLRVPDVQPMLWAHWTAKDADDPLNLPVVSVIVWQINAGKPVATKLATLAAAPGTVLKVTPDQPGKYHLEVRIVPKHLRSLMKGLRDGEAGPELVDLEQRWAVGNPIEVK